MKQVDKEAYKFERYAHPGRWVSYYYQVREVLRCEPKKILEIGSGDGVFKNYIKENTTIEYSNVDVAEDLRPEVMGSVTQLPFADKSFDVVCAFEVLEHIPFSDFEKALKEMSRASRSNIIISLPHFGPPVQFLLKIPLLPEFRISFKIPFYRKHQFNGQHYWEIGKRGYSAERIRGLLSKYFIIQSEFIPFENQYHHFYVLTKLIN